MKDNKVVVLLNDPSSGLWASSPSRSEGNGVRGFTLIELLVVVLIIGILAAVAVPQYQKAVEKSKVVQAISLVKAGYQAYQAFYLTHGEYPSTVAQLDIDLPWVGNKEWTSGASAQSYVSNDEWSFLLYGTSGGPVGVCVGRLSGPYAGTGFCMIDHKLFCAERTAYGKIFQGQAGDYCEKIFQASFAPSVLPSRSYTMP